jgi:hypothetical protein
MANDKFSSSNSIFVIHPYKREGVWAFDDAQRGLLREAFVAGADTLIEMVTTRAGIPSADFERGITLFFSAKPFPGAQLCVKRTRGDLGGNWYYSPDYQFEGWLCPAMFKYFASAPDEIHFQVKPL